MPSHCLLCKSRTRRDATCSSEICDNYRTALRGSHWRRTRPSIGTLSQQVGAFVAGGFILTLLHRHDIRVAIASGMFLKQFVIITARRLEILFFIAPCYWKWSTSHVLSSIVAQYGKYCTADPVARADMLQIAWGDMVKRMSDYQVVTQNTDVLLMHRNDAKKLGGISDGVYKYHPFMNPSSRRNGTHHFESLLEDLRNSRLCRLCEDLARVFHDRPTYARALKVLEAGDVKLFEGNTYRRTRLDPERKSCYKFL